MNRRKNSLSRRFLAMLLTAVMLITLLPVGAFADEGGYIIGMGSDTATSESPLKISNSKSATNLDKDYKSNIVLSVPSAEEQLVTDVVFVLDKSTSTDVQKGAVDMLQALNKQLTDTGAKVNVGVVIFNKNAHRQLELTELNDANLNKIEEAIKTNMSSGTNTHAGLLAGKAMLDEDTDVDESRKYLIFASDGITYLYGESETPTAIALQNADKTTSFAGPDNWETKYENNTAPENGWANWLTAVEQQIEEDAEKYDAPYGQHNSYIPYDEREKHAMAIDKALYLTYTTYRSMSESYHCYAMTADTDTGKKYAWGPSFMDFLADEQSVSFEDIQNDIYYLVDDGSTIEDYMGYVEDDKGYNFDLVINDDLSNLYMTLEKNDSEGNATVETLKAVRVGTDTNTYAFGEADEDGKYPYTLVYYPANDGSEHFVWTTNVPVTITERVQIHYTVQLTNPQLVEGTYGEYDQYGENLKEGLYTNNSATLYPVDSKGVKDDQGVDFKKPTVSYTVSAPEDPVIPEEPDYPVIIPDPDGNDTPELNTDDHYSYIVGYPEDYRTGVTTDDEDLWPVKPQGNITRAEVATIFYRLLTDDARAKNWTHDNDFTDVDDDDWFVAPVATLSAMGIVGGYEDGSFRPNAAITRAEFAAIASRFFTETGYEYEPGTFTDVTGSEWFADALADAYEHDIIGGYPDGSFKPNQSITRAEACSIVNRTLDRIPHEDYLLPVSIMRIWPDNLRGAWYYADMQEATNSHEYEWMATGSNRHENWTSDREEIDWAEVERILEIEHGYVR